jgi:hypothetical protein
MRRETAVAVTTAGHGPGILLAAEACFGTSQWPAELPVPQVSIVFDVAERRGALASGPGSLSAGALGSAVAYVGLFPEGHRSRMAGAGPRSEQQEHA